MSKKDRFGLIGNTIAGTFRVDRLVAEGGFGIVYQAFHLHFRVPVALKCLKVPGDLSTAERQEFLEQFRSEAEIQFRLSAQLPHIVRPLHVDSVQTKEGEFVPLMALEWLEGQSFEELIEERVFAGKDPMALTEAMTLIAPVARALHYAHGFESAGEQLSVLHRDVKPDNLFLTKIGGEPFVKLLDFGISKMRRTANRLAGQFSQTDGKAPFSPAYGAPEQWVPKRLGQTGPWTDVWGLALTLVEIIKGDAVILGDHQEMMGTALDPKVRPSPRSEGVLISDEVEEVFQKALALDPRSRYQSIRSFWKALEAANLQSGDLTLRTKAAEGTQLASTPLSAPPPWSSLGRDTPETRATQTSLPPMMAPAKMEQTHVEDLEAELEASYPTDPSSDLKPVLPAATSWDNFDPEIPPSSGETESAEHSYASSARIRAARRIAEDPPNADQLLDKEAFLSEPYGSSPLGDAPVDAPPSNLELQPTSAFPHLGSSTSLPKELQEQTAPPPPIVSPHSGVLSTRKEEAPRPLSLIPTDKKQSSGS